MARFYVETMDDKGYIEVDSFETEADAMAFGLMLVQEAGAPYADVCDRDEIRNIAVLAPFTAVGPSDFGWKV